MGEERAVTPPQPPSMDPSICAGDTQDDSSLCLYSVGSLPFSRNIQFIGIPGFNTDAGSVFPHGKKKKIEHAGIMIIVHGWLTWEGDIRERWEPW